MTDISDVPARPFAHVRIERFQSSAAYGRRRGGSEHKAIRDDYAAHAEQLLRALEAALPPFPPAGEDDRLTVRGLKSGSLVQIETLEPANESTSKIPADFEFKAKGITVLRTERDALNESAVVFVPDDARDFLRERLENYGRDPGNAQRADLLRFETIEHITAADGTALFSPPLTTPVLEPVWWEVWVRNGEAFADRVAALASRQEALEVHRDRLIFPETVVVFIHATSAGLQSFASRLPGALMEIRRAVDTVQVFMEEHREKGLTPFDHIRELASRVTSAPENAPTVCLLDTGVAAAHPLVAPGLAGAWAFDEAWGSDDHYGEDGHGTGLASLVLFGDLFGAMADQRAVQLTHQVESVKYLSPNPGEVELPSYGAITQASVALAEIGGGIRSRTFCIASSTNLSPVERPSSWSGAIDQISAGAMPGELTEPMKASETPKRLVLIAAGNILGGQRGDVRQGAPIEDPAQSWNALTIGGYTTKDRIEPFNLGEDPYGVTNDVSPFSRGSQTLPSDLTPIKPEVLFEAGNMFTDRTGYCGPHPSLSLLAAGRDVLQRPLIPFEATSAAVAVAGHFAGRLEASLPGLWPETYRALMVHSADWTTPMRRRLIGRGAHWKGASLGDRQSIVREQGYGVPNLERAVTSARNDLALLAQSEIQPFTAPEGGGAGVFNEVHFYDLPWPRETLQAIFDGTVTMKVTLSYFVEPNLSGRAATRPDTYRSFGLRFALKRRRESRRQFKQRYSRALAEDRLPTGGTEPDYWLLGPNAISAGSLHCDLWRGKAVDLAGHDAIAVYPVGGWWKNLVRKRRINDKARYSLVISLDARDHEVDLAAEVQTIVDAVMIKT